MIFNGRGELRGDRLVWAVCEGMGQAIMDTVYMRGSGGGGGTGGPELQVHRLASTEQTQTPEI